MNWYKKAQQQYLWEDDEYLPRVGKHIDSSLQDFIKSFGPPYYHGTNYQFKEFSLRNFGSTDEGFAGRGLYFTTNPGYAKEYGQNIKEVYLELNNPYIIDDTSFFNPDYMKRKLALPENASASEVTMRLQSMGHDGVVVNYSPDDFDDDIDGDLDGFETVVFSPSQVITREQVIDMWEQAKPFYQEEEGYDARRAVTPREIKPQKPQQVTSFLNGNKKAQKIELFREPVKFDSSEGIHSVKLGPATLIYHVLPDNTVSLSSLRVAHKYRNQGYAKQALFEFSKWLDLNGFSSTLGASPLDSKTNNEKLEKLYRGFGYSPTGRHINPVKDKEMKREPQ